MEGVDRVLNTLHFKYAIEVERTGSITQAAENLFMGQPNLSKAIMELEETLGFQIFERTSKGVIPTDKGSVFLVYAKNVLASIEKMEALSDKNSAAQTLSVAYPRSINITSAVKKLAASLDFSGKLRLNIRETNSVQIINSVSAGMFNLGIVRYRLLHEKYFTDYIHDKDLDVIPFWEFDSMVLTSERNYKNAEKITFQELAGMTPITFGDESIPYLSFGEVHRDAKSPAADKAVFVYDRATALDLLSSIQDSFILTSPIAKKDLEKYGLVQKKCEIPNERTKDMIVFQRGYKLTPLDRKFIDLLSEIKNETEFGLR
jgi:DNA-binding transcriptional LysR family regulator